MTFEGDLSEPEWRVASAIGQDATETLFDQRAYRGVLFRREAFGLVEEGVWNLHSSFHMATHILRNGHMSSGRIQRSAFVMLKCS